LAIIIASALATSFSDRQLSPTDGRIQRAWEMDIHLITIEIGIVGITVNQLHRLIRG